MNIEEQEHQELGGSQRPSKEDLLDMLELHYRNIESLPDRKSVV